MTTNVNDSLLSRLNNIKQQYANQYAKSEQESKGLTNAIITRPVNSLPYDPMGALGLQLADMFSLSPLLLKFYNSYYPDAKLPAADIFGDRNFEKVNMQRLGVPVG